MTFFQKKNTCNAVKRIPSWMILDGVHCVAQNQIEWTAKQDTEVCSSGTDPWLLFQSDQPSCCFFVQFDAQSAQNLNPAIYYGYEQRGGTLSPENTVLLEPKRLAQGVLLKFERPVSFLRLDPMEMCGTLQLRCCVLRCAVQEETGDVCTVRWTYCAGDEEATLAEVCEKLRGGTLNPARTILLFTHEMTDTGASQLCCNLGRRLTQEGWDVIVVAHAQGAATNQFERFAKGLFVTFGVPAVLDKIVIALAECGANKAMLNTVLTGTSAAVLHENGYQTVALIHEMRASCAICDAHNQSKLLAHYADVVVFPAQCVHLDFERFVGGSVCGKVVIQPQGLYKKETVTDRQSSAKAIRTRLGFPENSRLIVSAGSLNFGKGADLLPLLAKELARQDAELAGTVQFVWLGSAAETSFPAWLLVQIEKMELSGCIHFPGFFENEKEYMACLAGADVFLLPSREDSMPSVLLEAMAAGTPTLAFCKSGGADELLRGDCGVLTPFCDLQQMAQQLCRLLRDEPFARQIAENAKLRQQSALSFDGYVDLLAAEFERAGD